MPHCHATEGQHPLNVVEENKVLNGSSNIISDRIGFLPARLAKSRKNPLQVPVREIRVIIETGKVLRIVTNDLDAPAQEIADLYKARWQFELFFRWVKQTLKITHFIGVSENAVRIQVAIALIAFPLLRLARETEKAIRSPLVRTIGARQPDAEAANRRTARSGKAARS